MKINKLNLLFIEICFFVVCLCLAIQCAEIDEEKLDVHTGTDNSMQERPEGHDNCMDRFLYFIEQMKAEEEGAMEASTTNMTEEMKRRSCIYKAAFAGSMLVSLGCFLSMFIIYETGMLDKTQTSIYGAFGWFSIIMAPQLLTPIGAYAYECCYHDGELLAERASGMGCCCTHHTWP